MIGNPLSVEDIISELQQGGIRIPEIQRDYVWRRSQVAKLLDSLYNDYPTGSLLLWDTSDEGIVRSLRTSLGASTKSNFIPKIVLDGQQRITSLGRIFDPGTAKYDRILFSVLTEAFESYSPRAAADPAWVDVTELFTENINELDVIDRLTELGTIPVGDRETRKVVHDRLKKLVGIRKYKYPVEIVRGEDLETITEIFIRVNSGGTRLRDAELALARLAWKLPGSIVGPFERLEDECVERGFDLDTRFLMRTLIAVATGQSRFRDLKAFWERDPRIIQRDWGRTERGLRHALDFVEGNVGIPGSEFLPSQFSLVPLAVVFASRERLSGEEEKMLRRWFLVANSFSHFAGTAETTLNQDLTVLGKEVNNIPGLLEQLARQLRNQTIVTEQDIEGKGASSPFFPLAYLAVIHRDGKDWFTGIRLRRDNFATDQNIEYHHIFPKKLLDGRNVDRYTRDEMANLAFLGQKANKRISASEPATYLARIAEESPDRLEAQMVPMSPELWSLDRFDEFLAVRRRALVAAMNAMIER